ncbi:alpha/beta fold hydrolase [Streptomyces sp. S1D4-11]
MTTSATEPLAAGTHTVEIDGVVQRYHVHGTGPVCVAHSGGPGIEWEYLRMPALERHLTMVYLEPIGTGGSGRLPSHPHGYTRPRYSRFLGALVEHLSVPEVYLLGHSHGGFVTQYHALHHPERVAGVILYESAPLTGPEHITEAVRLVQSFAALHADHPELPEVLAAFQAIPTISCDVEMTAVARGCSPHTSPTTGAGRRSSLPCVPRCGPRTSPGWTKPFPRTSSTTVRTSAHSPYRPSSSSVATTSSAGCDGPRNCTC